MFTKVLIANRGAIAVRIIRTLKALNIGSVAVFAQSDADSLHVSLADEAYALGEGPASETYLNVETILELAERSGAQAIHPGYGFLSENARFVEACEERGLAFIGPRVEQIESFGLKHRARQIAEASGVPLVPGTGVLASLEEAQQEAERIGYPIMLKSSAGGGGIGMQLCRTAEELLSAYETVKRLGANNFADDSIFLEKFIEHARHIEVQVFGDGSGKALAIGERDCSSQRRNQKVIEECPAPNLTASVRASLHDTAERLLASVDYRNAGTVEFIYDTDTDQFYFLEVNTRLQVEHGVTEEVYGVDLVEWMVALASGESLELDQIRAELDPSGHAVQARLYAEDPYRDFQPCADLLSAVSFPEFEGLRIDHWISAGLEIPPYFDPMLAKVIVKGESREAAFEGLSRALNETSIHGCETNLRYLRNLVDDDRLRAGRVTTAYLNEYQYQPARIDVISGGTQTTVQDYPGRSGYWSVGVPPSGAFDWHSFQLANRLLGNEPSAAGLEMAVSGPTLSFSSDTSLVLAGAEMEAILDGKPLSFWCVIPVKAGQTLKLGKILGAGARTYMAVTGGLDCPDYLGSKSTFTLGQFGGHNGRALRTGDVLHLDSVQGGTSVPSLSESLRPAITSNWTLHVIYGPHGAPDFFTDADIERFFAHEWEVHYNSSRTGIRLIGPKPEWARKDGGEAGLHPSNIHDNAYAFGTVDFTGDMPVILGPDGPSLGGFVCPATVIQADLWKLGQLSAGDKIRFVPVSLEQAVTFEATQQRSLECLNPIEPELKPVELTSPVISRLSEAEVGIDVVYRIAGDHFLLVEYGELTLDIALRFRVHALMQQLQTQQIKGVRELTPGIRSLQIHYDSQTLTHTDLLAILHQAEQELSDRVNELRLPSRVVHLPLSWDDEVCQKAIEKYDQTVRKDAPWSPSNIEFIRRINGLASIDAVKQVVFDASYLVMGLGDVYLGAPVATPVNPKHRLVTTKYNPARTWTAENSVGIGGSYLCVYGMEGPGGYQFVGRTLQMWNRYRQTQEFEQPWLLRFFDQIRFYEVSQAELEEIRRNFPQGRYPLQISETSFSLSDYQELLNSERETIDSFKRVREEAFANELARWHRDGQFNFEVIETTAETTEVTWSDTALVLDSPVSGSVWQTSVKVGAQVDAGECVMILESMKMEIPIHATEAGQVTQLLSEAGQRVRAGQPLVIIEPVIEE